MGNGKEIHHGYSCFFNHRKHSIVGVLYPKLRPKQEDKFNPNPPSIYQGFVAFRGKEFEKVKIYPF
jgi:hypothetical protein